MIILNKQYFSPVFIADFLDGKIEDKKRFRKPSDNQSKMIKGKQYLLKNNDCDGFKMKPEVYEFVHDLNKVNGIDIDGYIVKRQYDKDKENPVIISLTKNDCKMIGIPFQEGLEICPKDMEWEQIVTEEEKAKNEIQKLEEVIKIITNPYFVNDDLSTYPCDKNSGNIKRMLLNVSGFNLSGYVLSHRNSILQLGFNGSIDDIARKIYVVFKNTGNVVPFRLIEPININAFTNNVTIELLFDKILTNGFTKEFFKNKTFSDIFDVIIVSNAERYSKTNYLRQITNNI